MSIADGRKIAIKFTQPLVGNVTGLNPPLGYKKVPLDLSAATITTLNQYNTSYTGAKAVDGDTSTYWRGKTAVNWIQFRLATAKVVTQIKMYLGSYYIKTFTFSGSNDGVTWVQLGGEYTAANSTTAQWYTFAFDNDDAYLYYRIDTLTAYSTSRIYLYEVDLYEDVPVGNEARFKAEFEQYNYVPGGTLSKVTRVPLTVEQNLTVDAQIDISSGVYDDVILVADGLTLAFSGEEVE